MPYAVSFTRQDKAALILLPISLFLSTSKRHSGQPICEVRQTHCPRVQQASDPLSPVITRCSGQLGKSVAISSNSLANRTSCVVVRLAVTQPQFQSKRNLKIPTEASLLPSHPRQILRHLQVIYSIAVPRHSQTVDGLHRTDSQRYIICSYSYPHLIPAFRDSVTL